MYATLDDLIKQLSEDSLIQLTDDDGTGAIVTTVTDAALEAADVEIDGYLGGRYALPLDPAPAIITKMAVDIAIYNLYARRLGPPDHWQKRYSNVIRFLERAARGDISLGVGDPEAGSDDGAQTTGPDRVFTRDSLSGF